MYKYRQQFLVKFWVYQ